MKVLYRMLNVDGNGLLKRTRWWFSKEKLLRSKGTDAKDDISVSDLQIKKDSGGSDQTSKHWKTTNSQGRPWVSLWSFILRDLYVNEEIHIGSWIVRGEIWTINLKSTAHGDKAKQRQNFQVILSLEGLPQPYTFHPNLMDKKLNFEESFLRSV